MTSTIWRDSVIYQQLLNLQLETIINCLRRQDSTIAIYIQRFKLIAISVYKD